MLAAPLFSSAQPVGVPLYAMRPPYDAGCMRSLIAAAIAAALVGSSVVSRNGASCVSQRAPQLALHTPSEQSAVLIGGAVLDP